LSAAIERLLHNAAMRTALGGNAKRFAETNFTLFGMRQRHEALYTDLLVQKTRQNAKRYDRL
jgi:hypothetical protein